MQKNGVVLVCVTPQISCKKLIDAGAAIAAEKDAHVRIISVFPQRQCFNPDLNALEALNRAACEINAEMTVCFSDSPVDRVAEYAAEHRTVTVVAGFPKDGGCRFITELYALMPGMPLSMVDDDGTSYAVVPSMKSGYKTAI